MESMLSGCADVLAALVRTWEDFLNCHAKPTDESETP